MGAFEVTEAGDSRGMWSPLAVAEGELEPWHRNCVSYTSPWSPCSTSCGLGISTRVSNANAHCWPEQESRLCNLRPCDVDIRPLIKVGPPPGVAGWAGVSDLTGKLGFELGS